LTAQSQIDKVLAWPASADAMKVSLPAYYCLALTGRAPKNPNCVIIRIDNNAPFEEHRGRADSHFASYYDLLKTTPNPLYLPVAASGDMCDDYRRGGSPGVQCVPVTYTGK
jgi:hypothetical protein